MQFTYDDVGNRETVVDSSAMTFTYSGAGKRLSKQDSGGTIKYMYDMDNVVLERNAQDTTVAGYSHEGGSPGPSAMAADCVITT